MIGRDQYAVTVVNRFTQQMGAADFVFNDAFMTAERNFVDAQ